MKGRLYRNYMAGELGLKEIGVLPENNPLPLQSNIANLWVKVFLHLLAKTSARPNPDGSVNMLPLLNLVWGPFPFATLCPTVCLPGNRPSFSYLLLFALGS